MIVATLAITAVFAEGAYSKLIDLDSFRQALSLQDILPRESFDFVALAIPVAEAVLVAGLLGGLVLRRLLPWSLLCSLGMVVSLTLYLAVVFLVRGANEACGCGRIMEAMAGDALLRNSAIIGGLMLAFIAATRRNVNAADAADVSDSGESG